MLQSLFGYLTLRTEWTNEIKIKKKIIQLDSLHKTYWTKKINKRKYRDIMKHTQTKYDKDSNGDDTQSYDFSLFRFQYELSN